MMHNKNKIVTDEELIEAFRISKELLQSSPLFKLYWKARNIRIKSVDSYLDILKAATKLSLSEQQLK